MSVEADRGGVTSGEGELPVSPEAVSPEPAPAEDLEEGPEDLKEQACYLRMKLDEMQSESTLLKEWGARIEMYVDCLVDALDTNDITHVYDVDGSLVSLDECRQKAKTLPHTRKPHCDEDIRTKQFEAEIDKLRREMADLTAQLEETGQRSAEQAYLVEQLRAAEYQANVRWEAYHESAMQQWSRSYSDLQGQYNEAVVRVQNLSTACGRLGKTGPAAGVGQPGPLSRHDPFKRHRAAPERRYLASAQLGQYDRRSAVTSDTADSGERERGAHYHHNHHQSRDWRARSDPAAAPPLPRAERAAILKQFFDNLNLIQRRQSDWVGARWSSRRYEPRRPRQRPGPYGEAN